MTQPDPDPFRRYAGAPVVILPLAKDSLGDDEARTYEQLYTNASRRGFRLGRLAFSLNWFWD